MKSRKSIPISEAAAVNTHQVNVAVEGLDCTRMSGSFSVHLLKDGKRIASRFMFQPSESGEHVEAIDTHRLAHFDFLLPVDAVANGKLSVEIEPLEAGDLKERLSPEQMGHPTMSIYLLLDTD